MPFPGGVEATPNATLVFSAGMALFYLLAIDMSPKLTRSAAKTLSVALLALLVAVQHGPWLLVAALALSATGDAFLSRDGDKAFLGGLASFLAAHVLYVGLFLLTGRGAGFVADEPWRLAGGVAMAVFAVAMLGALWRRVGPELRAPVAVYVVAILAMGLAALTSGGLIVPAGAVLFMASDGLLAAEKFLLPAISAHRHWMRRAVWVLYYAAQCAIVFGFLLA